GREHARAGSPRRLARLAASGSPSGVRSGVRADRGEDVQSDRSDGGRYARRRRRRELRVDRHLRHAERDRDVRRLGGRRLEVTSGELAAGADPDSFVNQLADGTYTDGYFWTGATSSNVTAVGNQSCASWTSTSNQFAVCGVSRDAQGAQFWSGVMTSCSATNL